MVTTGFVTPRACPPFVRCSPRRSIAVEDVDGDGYLDVVASFWSDSIQWFKNVNGLGGVSAELPVDAEENDEYVSLPVSVPVADLDGDGDFDVVSASLDGMHVLLDPFSVVKFVRR